MAGRILIVDDQATGRLTLRVRLTEARYDVATAASGAEALEILARSPADLVILDERLGDMGGPALCRRLRADPAMRDAPVLMLVGARDGAARIAALDAGAEDVLSRPFCDLSLMARVRSLMRVRETRVETQRRRATAAEFGFAEASTGFEAPGRIALVSADPATADRWRAGLGRHIPDAVQVLSAEAALDEADRARPAEVFVIDADLPRPGGGLMLLSDLRSRPGTRHAAMIFAHRDDEAEAGATALDLGANDLLPLCADTAELAIRIRTQIGRARDAQRLRDTVEDGLRLAATDALTGLFNRRYALAYLERVARETQSSGRCFAVMVADLDHFKRINDSFGHATGDAVLRGVAHRIRDRLRGEDMVARLGGEEFLIVMPDTDFAAALPAAERLCRAIADAPVPPGPGQPPVPVTISIGVAIGGGREGGAIHGLIEHADRALYRAKAQGRNTVDVFRPAA
jgi:two-component system cell cycle response regulator